MTTSFYTLCDRGAFVYLSIFSSTIPEISLRAYLGIPVLCHKMSVQADLLTQPCLKPVHCPIAVAMAKLPSYKSREVHDWPKQLQSPSGYDITFCCLAPLTRPAQMGSFTRVHLQCFASLPTEN